MNKFVRMWQSLFDKLMLKGGRRMVFTDEKRRRVPKHIVAARRAANRRARTSRLFNRLREKGKQI